MRRSRKLVILLAVLVVLAGATALVKWLTPEETEEAAEPIGVLSVDGESLIALSWEYGGESVRFDCADGVWTYSEDDAFPVDSTHLEGMLSALSDVTASRVIESPSDLADYGLEEPLCTVTVTTGDETVQLLLGDETGLGGERYASIGDGRVYLVDDGLLDSFVYGLYDLVEMESIPDLSSLDSLTLTADGQTESWYWQEAEDEDGEDAWILEDGTQTDAETAEALAAALADLSWSSCVSYAAGDEELAEYGLDTPAASVTAQYTQSVQVDTGETDDDGNEVYETREIGQTFVLEIGSQSGDLRYARIAGSGMVYLIDAAQWDSVIASGDTASED